MSDVTDHREAVQDLARAVYKIAAVDVPELEITDGMVMEEMHGDNWIETQQDDNWWGAWCEIYDIVENHGAAEIGDNQIKPGVEPHRRYDEVRAKTEWTSLSVKVYAAGDVRILAEYDNSTQSWVVLYEGRPSNNPVDPIQLGREVASSELAHLAEATGSAKVALDYWQTSEWYRQRQWADIRGVGRQTVNDSVREAKNALD